MNHHPLPPTPPPGPTGGQKLQASASDEASPQPCKAPPRINKKMRDGTTRTTLQVQPSQVGCLLVYVFATNAASFVAIASPPTPSYQKKSNIASSLSVWGTKDIDIPEPADLDWYRLLGVKQEVTVDEIKKAFRKLALVHHPDKVGGRPDAGSRFRRIREAHDTLCDAHRRCSFDVRYERISAEWDKYEAAQEDNRVKREAERVRKQKLEKKAASERAARERMERERSHLEEMEKLRADVQNIERSCKKERECTDRESRANIPMSPDKTEETGKPHGFAWRHDTILLRFMEQYLEKVRIDMQNHEKLYEEMRNRHKQASEEEAQAEAAEEEAEERQARERKAQKDAARKKEAEEKAAKAEAEREKVKEKAKMEREAREKGMRERERLAEQRSQEAARRAREAQEAAARERLAHQSRADKEAREAKAAEEEARRRMTPELEEMFKLFQEFRIRSEKESRKSRRRKSARGSDCTQRMWWPRSYGTDDCEYCGRLCTRYTLRCPDCDARACVPCKIEQAGT